jgi:hypothetical protein
METSTSPDFGHALRAGTEWEGCYAAHVGRDRYRVIWELLDPEPDPDQIAEQLISVLIIRVGPKTDSSGHTIYEQGRPGSDAL